ncbi:MAG TPA: NTP transferase domain-containing protein, partial [Gemmatimonadales bacterium]|nr:NTP transferase domain-containing protein [Gemmatimonadales bacterium]
MTPVPGATRQTVILAAGSGSRLSTQRGDLPKPLVPVAGRALIEHALDQAVAAGVEEAIVVTGNAADQMREHLARLTLPIRLNLVHNHRFLEPNGVSLLAAAPYVTGPFYLQMADHVFAEPVLQRLDPEPPGAPGAMRLLVDFQPVGVDEEDATKVRVREGLIRAIGKDVRPFDAVDTGCFRLDPLIFAALREVERIEPPSVTLGMRWLVARDGLAAVALSGVRWTDVDTPADYATAEQLLGGRSRRRADQILAAIRQF